MTADQSISVIIPTLNEEDAVNELIESLQAQNHQVEIIVVDGGSTDRTLSLLSQKQNIAVKQSPKGRATQMNFGAQHASGNILAFVHADTKIPKDFLQKIASVPQRSWGYFNVALSGSKAIHRVIAGMMNIRCSVTSVITGDMVLVICTDLFTQINGFQTLPIMEDVEISKRLRRHHKPQRLNSTVTTSSRRWDNNGIYKTIFLMWRLRLKYFLGTNPIQLAKMYQKK